MLAGRLLLTLGINFIKLYIFLNYINLFFIHLLPILVHECIKYQRGCDTWKVTANIALPCLFLTKSHECRVNFAISSRNFSSYYIIRNILHVCLPPILYNTPWAPLWVSFYDRTSATYSSHITDMISENVRRILPLYIMMTRDRSHRSARLKRLALECAFYRRHLLQHFIWATP